MKLSINTASRAPIYQQIVQQIREAVARGELAAETRLPSVRELARELVVNPNTIARAYSELEREGLVVSRQGLGVFAALAQPELTKAARERRLRGIVDQLLIEAVHLGFTADDVLRQVSSRLERFQWSSAGTK